MRINLILTNNINLSLQILPKGFPSSKISRSLIINPQDKAVSPVICKKSHDTPFTKIYSQSFILLLSWLSTSPKNIAQHLFKNIKILANVNPIRIENTTQYTQNTSLHLHSIISSIFRAIFSS